MNITCFAFILFSSIACRALNGFLNTGRGGTVYLGVTDEGVVKGLYLNQDQVTDQATTTQCLHVLYAGAEEVQHEYLDL